MRPDLSLLSAITVAELAEGQRDASRRIPMSPIEIGIEGEVELETLRSLLDEKFGKGTYMLSKAEPSKCNAVGGAPGLFEIPPFVYGHCKQNRMPLRDPGTLDEAIRRRAQQYGRVRARALNAQ